MRGIAWTARDVVTITDAQFHLLLRLTESQQLFRLKVNKQVLRALLELGGIGRGEDVGGCAQFFVTGRGKFIVDSVCYRQSVPRLLEQSDQKVEGLPGILVPLGRGGL